MAARGVIAETWGQELGATFRLAWPLVVAQLAQMALSTTDVIMMGWLGPEPLAAGNLAVILVHPLAFFGVGLLTATAPMISQALGAGRYREVRRTVRPGLWIALLLSLFFVPVALAGGPILRLLGQQPDLTLLSAEYLVYAAWSIPAMMLIIPPRSLVSARGDTPVVLTITLFGVGLNALSNYGLMFGNFGLPDMGLAGAGVSTTLTAWTMFALMLGYITFHKRYRRYHVLLRPLRPDWRQFRDIWRIGTPIGLQFLAEIGVFALAALMMGWISVTALAAHAVALQLAAIAFMVPFGLSQATTIRVGLSYGRSDGAGVRRAGYASLAVSGGFSLVTCLAFILAPMAFVSLFLDPSDPANRESALLAASFLVIAGVFQFVDGWQVVSAAALRGLSDTRIPMIVAVTGYWFVGAPLGYFLAFPLDMNGAGIWWGLAAGLGFVAITLTARFAFRQRLGLERGMATA